MAFYTDRNQIIQFLTQNGITNYTINSNLVVDVNGDVNLASKNLIDIPVQFGRVEGSFNCNYNTDMRSLSGAPSYVGLDFSCVNTKITSLQGGPSSVGRNYVCRLNYLSNLSGAPGIIYGNFDFTDNQSPSTILAGGPNLVIGNFDCYLSKITSLLGAPREIRGTFDCSNNRIVVLTGSPAIVGKDYHVNSNATRFSVSDVRSICNVGGTVYTSSGNGKADGTEENESNCEA